MIEGYAKGMLKTTYQKTKRPDRVIKPTETLLELKELAEAGGYSFAISRTEETYANVRLDNKPFRVDLDNDLAGMAEQVGILTIEPITQDVTPSAMELILEHDIDPSLITGTGNDGRILKKDVENYLK